MSYKKFVSAIKGGIASVQGVYNKQMQAIEDRAERKLAKAKTKDERAIVQANLERERFKLKAKMYRAQAAVLKEKAAVAKAKKAAGGSGFMAKAQKALKDFQKAQKKYEARGRKPRQRTVKK